MMDIDRELEGLIEKYNIDRHYPAYRESRRACEYLRGWIQKLSDEKKEFVFITMDEQVLWLINVWGKKAPNISSLYITNVKELEIHEEEIKEKKLYVVAMTRTVEILHWLWRHSYHAESVYDILENEGIYVQMEFYRFFYPIKDAEELDLYYRWVEDSGRSLDGLTITLLEYHYQKMRVEYATDERDRKRINEKLFFLAVCMRNFVEAERILNGMKNADGFGKFWDEVCVLFRSIKKELHTRRQEDIVVYWLDALAYKDGQKMDYLRERAVHSVYFHNAYTVTPWTNATCRTIFCRKLDVDDLGYREGHVGLDNSPLLQDIEAHGYDIHVLSGVLVKMFETENCDVTIRRSDACAEILWKMLEHMMRDEGKKTVFLPHILLEIHAPAYSVRKDRFDKKHISAPQLDELDAQLRFYDGLLGDGVKRIYMSDHGYSWMNAVNRPHILFQAYCQEWSGKETSKIFSLLDFDKILHQMMEGGEIEDSLWEGEFAVLQSVDIYNKEFLRDVFHRKAGVEDYMAYKGLITKEKCYICFKSGEEVLVALSDMEKDMPIVFYADKSAHDRQECEKLRKIVGGFPKELDTDEKFKYSRYMYPVCENVKKTVVELMRLLNDKFAGYPDNSIVLRMGGNHSYHLYAMLSVENKKKICGIIDRNADCICSGVGLPVVSDVNELANRPKASVLSSYLNLEALKEEARQQYASLEVIDIYEYMREYGYDLNTNFWSGIDSDWNVGFPIG